MNVVDTAVRLSPVVAALVTLILGAQLWRIGVEKRKTVAETKRTDMDSAGSLAASAIQLLDPYSRAFRAIDGWSSEMNRLLDAMERYNDRRDDWELYVMRMARENGWPVDPPPKRPKFGRRPAFHPLVDRGDDGKGNQPLEGDP